MSTLLDRAIEEAQKLPERDQDAIGAWLLAEIESERRWDELFSRPAGAIERMAEEALADQWDRHLERDAASGKLEKLFERSRADHRAGKSKEL